ncbi:hypothetical protein C8J56DRAFT_1090697 [Mycena floridula]|nr:hypothetical protein C8J56DRAFT_1090697 [Mycena floridula]
MHQARTDLLPSTSTLVELCSSDRQPRSSSQASQPNPSAASPASIIDSSAMSMMTASQLDALVARTSQERATSVPPNFDNLTADQLDAMLHKVQAERRPVRNRAASLDSSQSHAPPSKRHGYPNGFMRNPAAESAPASGPGFSSSPLANHPVSNSGLNQSALFMTGFHSAPLASPSFIPRATFQVIPSISPSISTHSREETSMRPMVVTPQWTTPTRPENRSLMPVRGISTPENPWQDKDIPSSSIGSASESTVFALTRLSNAVGQLANPSSHSKMSPASASSIVASFISSSASANAPSPLPKTFPTAPSSPMAASFVSGSVNAPSSENHDLLPNQNATDVIHHSTSSTNAPVDPSNSSNSPSAQDIFLDHEALGFPLEAEDWEPDASMNPTHAQILRGGYRAINHIVHRMSQLTGKTPDSIIKRWKPVSGSKRVNAWPIYEKYLLENLEEEKASLPKGHPYHNVTKEDIEAPRAPNFYHHVKPARSGVL